MLRVTVSWFTERILPILFQNYGLHTFLTTRTLTRRRETPIRTVRKTIKLEPSNHRESQ